MSDLDGCVQDCVVAVINANLREAAREPERFVGFVHAIVKTAYLPQDCRP